MSLLLCRTLVGKSESLAFVDACPHHCGAWPDFNLAVDDTGITAETAFAKWLAKPTAAFYTKSSGFNYTTAGKLTSMRQECGGHAPDPPFGR